MYLEKNKESVEVKPPKKVDKPKVVRRKLPACNQFKPEAKTKKSSDKDPAFYQSLFFRRTV